MKNFNLGLSAKDNLNTEGENKLRIGPMVIFNYKDKNSKFMTKLRYYPEDNSLDSKTTFSNKNLFADLKIGFEKDKVKGRSSLSYKLNKHIYAGLEARFKKTSDKKYFVVGPKLTMRIKYNNN